MTEQTFGPYGQSDRGHQRDGPQRVDGYGQPRYPDPADKGSGFDRQPARLPQAHAPESGQRQPGQGQPSRAYPASATAVTSGYPQPTDAGIQGKRRNPFAAGFGLPLITLGIYSIIWIYKTNKELSEYDRRIVVDPTLSVLAVTLGVLLIVPPLVAVWRLCARTRQAQQSAGLAPLRTGVAFMIFLLGFGPLNLQLEINRIWDRYPSAVEGQQVPLPG
ncbi:DUF4234 domain-containing protein [Frankia sp. Cr2]|uniref:DUF4234 domain-containing protein n=1 Tax=Frankia sp. Cr2 TaxID=3073932 RepID=UPI002AD50ACC|nr:DUF4234 domain-containing protein [Frankia sp. Cr2]